MLCFRVAALATTVALTAMGCGETNTSATNDAAAQSQPETASDASSTLLEEFRDNEGVQGWAACPSTVAISGAVNESWENEGVVGVDGVPFESYAVAYASRPTPTGSPQLEVAAVRQADGSLAHTVSVRVFGLEQPAAYAVNWFDSSDSPFGQDFESGAGLRIENLEMENSVADDPATDTISLSVIFDC